MTPASKSNTEWLQSLPRTNGKPGVEGMRQLLAKLGNPQDYLDFVHVAGTNGKGTVSTLTANILKEAGYKTGLTISPYVLDFRERMQINGEMIPADVLEEVAGQVRAAAETLDEEPVQFTAVTAAALLWFYQEQCDLAVLETGVGGKNDASNGGTIPWWRPLPASIWITPRCWAIRWKPLRRKRLASSSPAARWFVIRCRTPRLSRLSWRSVSARRQSWCSPSRRI